MSRNKIEMGRVELEQAHNHYEEKAYLLAIEYFNKALLDLEWVPAEMHRLHFHKNYFKALEFIQKIWGWLGIIYRETGHNQKATECFTKETYYAHLIQIYQQKYVEFKYIRRMQRKMLLHDIEIMISVGLILLFSGINISFIFNDNSLYVNFAFFLIDFIIFLVFLVKIRNSYGIRKEFRKDPLIFCPGLKKYLSKYSKKRQRLIDNVCRNIFSSTFVVLVMSLYLSIAFIQAISIGNLTMNGLINGTGFHVGYFSLILFALVIELLLLHWNKTITRKKMKIAS